MVINGEHSVNWMMVKNGLKMDLLGIISYYNQSYFVKGLKNGMKYLMLIHFLLYKVIGKSDRNVD